MIMYVFMGKEKSGDFGDHNISFCGFPWNVKRPTSFNSYPTFLYFQRNKKKSLFWSIQPYSKKVLGHTL